MTDGDAPCSYIRLSYSTSTPQLIDQVKNLYLCLHIMFSTYKVMEEEGVGVEILSLLFYFLLFPEYDSLVRSLRIGLENIIKAVFRGFQT